MSMFDPFVVPVEFWQRQDVIAALRGRDVAALFCLLRRFGASQMRIAFTTGVPPGRVSLIMRRRQRAVRALSTFEAIADGLQMPDHARRRSAASRSSRRGGNSAGNWRRGATPPRSLRSSWRGGSSTRAAPSPGSRSAGNTPRGSSGNAPTASWVRTDGILLKAFDETDVLVRERARHLAQALSGNAPRRSRPIAPAAQETLDSALKLADPDVRSRFAQLRVEPLPVRGVDARTMADEHPCSAPAQGD